MFGPGPLFQTGLFARLPANTAITIPHSENLYFIWEALQVQRAIFYSLMNFKKETETPFLRTPSWNGENLTFLKPCAFHAESVNRGIASVPINHYLEID